MTDPPHDNGESEQEAQEMHERYLRRKDIDPDRYSALNPAVLMASQERQQRMIDLLRTVRAVPLTDKTLLEVGCGSGANLLQFLMLGFAPHNLVGNELLEDRAQSARARLPSATQVIVGDATALDLPSNSFDIVFQSTVFSSILNPRVQEALAGRMWDLTAPGGGILWYDFTWNNPVNPDVRGVPLARVASLFPGGHMTARRVTLAPPLARMAAKLHPRIYDLLCIVPPLRTHVLCWISKPPRP